MTAPGSAPAAGGTTTPRTPATSSTPAASRTPRPARWFHWVLAVLAGAVLANGVPHFVNGMSGNEFPTPFADPPTVGLSPAVVNAAWGMTNFAIGYALLAFSRARIRRTFWFPAAVWVGALLFSLYLSSLVASQLAPVLRATNG